MFEHFFMCPYCFAQISMLLDPSVARQAYVEDCEVCCNPIDVKYEWRAGELHYFEAQPLGQ